ncbi:MAG: TlpA family protein disulfide reductase [Acidobacteria bacterium]|nr:TlpA family protein disulfide reductase [Acidobacteriota bacterium]
MAPHAEQDYAAAKAVVLEPGSMQRGLDEILDSGMLVFEAYRDLGDRTRAEAALDDMRALAVRTQSSPFAYYAIDQKIKYLTETGRKLDAQALYKAALASATSDFTAKEVQEDLTKRLKARDRQYEVLGQRAPEFLTKDQLWFPGKPQTLSELRGKVVVLEFWATWCAPCFDTFPDLIEWHEQFKDQGLVILGVTRYYGQVNGLPADEGRETEELKLFREKWRLPYDFVVGKDQSIQMLYGAMLLPTAAIIDRKGVVRYLETGTSTSRIEQMRDTIVRLLAEK